MLGAQTACHRHACARFAQDDMVAPDDMGFTQDDTAVPGGTVVPGARLFRGHGNREMLIIPRSGAGLRGSTY